MGRDISCPSAKKSYKTKREAEKAEGGPAERCKHCRFWHKIQKKGRSARRQRAKRQQ